MYNPDRWYDRAMAELEADLNDGFMTMEEFNHYVRELNEEYARMENNSDV